MSDGELVFAERFRKWSLDHPRQWHAASDTSGIISARAGFRTVDLTLYPFL